LPSMKTSFTWLLRNTCHIVTLDMDSALRVEHFEVVLCGAFAGISKYPMDGLATISDSITLLRNLNYKQTHQMMPIWNGFHTIALVIGVYMDMDTWMVYLLVHLLN